MNSNITSLHNLYVSVGGNLTDTYEDIANGVPVSDYVIIPDVVNAIAKKMAQLIQVFEQLNGG